MPGKNALNGRRGHCRSPLDFATDSKNYELCEWLRAPDCESGDGAMSDFRLAEWKEQGWKGTSTGTRWWSTSWGKSWGSGWEPASGSGHEPAAGDWKPSANKIAGKAAATSPKPDTSKDSGKGSGKSWGGRGKGGGQSSSSSSKV